MTPQTSMTSLSLIFYSQVGGSQAYPHCCHPKVADASLMKSLFFFLVPNTTEPDYKSKDWVFLNYTYKRFEGLTQRGSIPTYMKAGKL